jgi:hypothetical protein
VYNFIQDSIKKYDKIVITNYDKLMPKLDIITLRELINNIKIE